MNVAIIANRQKDTGLLFSKKICSFFEAKGSVCHICEQDVSEDNIHYTDPDKIPENVDFVLTIGGDGTLIQAARDLCGRDVPIIGFNMGTLGFLAELDVNSAKQAVDRLCSRDYFVENHMMVNGSVYRDGRCIFENFALNDVVISKFGHLHIINFDVFVDDQLLSDYSADGMIVATPTGSTAYNLSAGGPLILPNASMMVITPICAHALYSRSVCLPESSVIRIRVKNKPGVDSGCVLSFDGSASYALKAGDEVLLKKSRLSTRLLKFDHTSFIKVLQKKMS